MLTLEPLQFLVFLAAAVILAVTPGPGIMYVLARTVAGGRSDGLASSFGTAIGGLFHVGVAAAGLSALVAASAFAFSLVKYIGAAYLLYLGIRTILTARLAEGPALLQAAGTKRSLLEGILTEALNIKTAMFFLAFIPQFVNAHDALWPQFVFLGTICVVLNTLADVLVVFCTSRLLPRLRSSRRPAQLMSYSSGSVLIGLGAYLALADDGR